MINFCYFFRLFLQYISCIIYCEVVNCKKDSSRNLVESVLIIMARLLRRLLDYWTSTKSNIFKNYIDAIFGAIVLLVVPACALVTVFFVTDATWANYTFPLLTICVSGAYDTFGRYSPTSPAKAKLICRWVMEGIVVFFAALFTNCDTRWPLFIAPALLLICGLLVLREVYERISTAIAINS